MIASEADFTERVGAFHAAALGAGTWDTALRGLAQATGSRHGQLIGLGAGSAPAFNCFTDPHEGMAEAFAALPTHDPRVNSRVRVGARARELEVLSEVDFDTEGDCRRHPDYGEAIHRFDIPFICLSNLITRDGMMVGLSVNRTAAQGEVSAEEKQAFAMLAPHVRAAVLMQMALQDNAARLVAGAMEAVSAAVFVCDARGRVAAMSGPAAALVGPGGRLQLRQGHLSAPTDAAGALDAMIRAVAGESVLAGTPYRSLVLRDRAGGDPLLIEAAAVPGQTDMFGFGVAALVTVRLGRPSEERIAAHARELFGLTRAEAQIAAGLVAGRAPQAIADRLDVSVGTVRTHIRNLFDKVGVNSALELVAAITARI